MSPFSAIFGPCGRFRIDPVHGEGGAVIAHDLFDAEAGHPPPRLGRHTFAVDAFVAAARRVEPDHKARTAAGERWIPA
jgi:hypothetical protein